MYRFGGNYLSRGNSIAESFEVRKILIEKGVFGIEIRLVGLRRLII